MRDNASVELKYMHGKSFFCNQYFELEIKNGIFIGKYITDHITLDVAQSFVEESVKITSGKKLPSLFDSRNMKVLETSARKYYAELGSPMLASAVAMLVHGSSQELVGNLFIHFYKLSVPAKLFTDENKAIQWLEKFI